MCSTLSTLTLVVSIILSILFGLSPEQASGGMNTFQDSILKTYGGTSELNGSTAPLADLADKPAVYIGYMGFRKGLRAGYTGLVLPGSCVSSYFVYDLRGISLGGSIPINLPGRFSARFEGSYLFAMSSKADQNITWLTMPPGTRKWAWTRSCFYNLQAETLYAMDEKSSFIAGIRWESLSTTFGDPNPDYPFTVPYMESGLSIGLYQPFVGLAYKSTAGKTRSLFQLIGFPAMLASLQHFNTCNNAGIPFAHVGEENISNGYFFEIKAEFGLDALSGLDVSAFLLWDMFRGTCTMNLERRDGAIPPSVTSADVDFLYQRSNLTVGGKINFPFSIP